MEGSYGEMVWGLMLGFFMGLIALFWFKEATFSRRHQMGKISSMRAFFLQAWSPLTCSLLSAPTYNIYLLGIIAGLMINVGFGVLHLYY